MTEKLLALRHDVYRCAADFHGAMAKYFAALNADSSREDLSHLKLTAGEAGKGYNAALVALLKHLKSVPGDARTNQEAEQTERTISLLSFEVRRL